MVRDALGELLNREPDICVVAYARDGDEAVTMARAWKPDVALLDVCMPGSSGLDAALRLAKVLPRCRVIALSAQGGRPFVSQMVAAGVAGFVRKDQSVLELADAVRTVAAGGTCLPDPTDVPRGPETRLLSRRECAVLEEVAAGRPAREMAQSMGISTKTVDTYRRRMMAKLGLASQAELVRYAVALRGCPWP